MNDFFRIAVGKKLQTASHSIAGFEFFDLSENS